MAYAIEYKEQILKRLQKESVAKIAQETGISKPTLYNWKKQKEESREKNQSQEIERDITPKGIKQQELKEGKKNIRKPSLQETNQGFHPYKGVKDDYSFRQGLALYKRMQYRQAEPYFLESIRIQGRSYVKSIFFLGKIYEKQKRYEEARKQFARYIEIDKDKNPHARLELGRLDTLDGNYEEARKQFERYIEIDKDKTPHARLELGRLDTLDGNYEEARKQFERCIEIDKDKTPHTRLELGKLDVLDGNYEGARKQFERCIEIDKDKTPHTRLELGKLDVLEGNYEEARKQFERYIEIDKDKTPHARLELGRLDVLEGNYEGARKQFERCIEIDKDKSPYARLELGRLDVVEGKYEEARKQFAKYIEIDKDKSPHARLELGRLDVVEGKYEEARKQFVRYIEIDKDRTPHARLELGRLDVLEGNYEGARKQFERCIEIDKDRTPHARLELGRLDVLEGNYEEARSQFERCMQIKPKDEYAKQELEKLSQNQFSSQHDVQENKSIVMETENQDFYNRIRAKIRQETIEIGDIELIKREEKRLSQRDYYLLQIAIYEKIGQRQRALELIKQMEKEGLASKELTEIKERIKSKKAKIFDITNWDKVLGWQLEKSKEEEEWQKKFEEKHNGIETAKKVIKELQPREEIKHTSSLKLDEKAVKKESVWKYSKEVVEKKSKKKSEQKRKKDNLSTTKKETIAGAMSPVMQDVIKKLNLTYYVKMQPTNSDVVVQNKYIKKYDKLQSILECSTSNRRAQMELMLVLMNEGYGEVVEKSFAREDIDFIQNLIEECKQKKLLVEEARKQIDAYCL